MKEVSLRFLSLVRTLGGVAAFAVVVAVAATALTLHLAFSAGNAEAMRSLVRLSGRWMSGQHTDRVLVQAEVDSERRQLHSRAKLEVRSLENGRRRFYFLLNAGMRLRSALVSGAAGKLHEAQAQRLGMLLVVDTGAPIATDERIVIDIAYDGTPSTGPFGEPVKVDGSGIRLPALSFWYPNDMQSVFTADVRLTLPAGMEVAAAASELSRVPHGNVQEVHWVTERPGPALDIVAGNFTTSAHEIGGVEYRVHLAAGVELDPQRIADVAAAANTVFTERYGPSGTSRMAILVDPETRRSFNAGAGVIVLSDRDFRDGDYGFASLARQIAFNWWGSVIAEPRLTPGSGGGFVVDGMAEYSTLLAVENRFGVRGTTRLLETAVVDPAADTVLERADWITMLLGGETEKLAVRAKGAWVALMLRHLVGDDAFFQGLHSLLDRFRYRQATDRDLQAALQESSGKDLEPFFAEWVRSARFLDLSLDADSRGELTVSNLGTGSTPDSVDLWVFPKQAAGTEARRARVRPGEPVLLGPGDDYAVIDPELQWLDSRRANNAFPRRSSPLHVAASAASGNVATTAGESEPWSRSSVTSFVGGRPDHTWDFERALVSTPAWASNGSTLLVTHAQAGERIPQIATLAKDGTRTTIGSGTSAAPAADGSIFAAQRDRISRFGTDGKESTVLVRPGYELDHPLPSPGGGLIAYTAASGNRLALRLATVDGSDDRQLLSFPRQRFHYRWAPDGTRLFAIVPGTWDWQVVEIPVSSGALRQLAAGAAEIADLALSADGSRLAFTAAPALEYPENRRRLFVLQPGDRTVRSLDLPGYDLGSLCWLDDRSVLVVAESAPQDGPRILPARRELKRVHLDDGRFEDYP